MVAEWVRASTGDRTIDGSTPTAGEFEFGTLAIPLTLLCQCLSDETLLKAVGPFYLVSMPGEVKDPTSPHWNVSLVDSTSHSKIPSVRICGARRCPAQYQEEEEEEEKKQ